MIHTDPCPYLSKYSLDVLKKKTKVLGIFNADKKCFIKNNIESSSQKIWIRIRFHEIKDSHHCIQLHSLMWQSYFKISKQ